MDGRGASSTFLSRDFTAHILAIFSAAFEPIAEAARTAVLL
jgi:hypothetical protein